VEGVCLAAFVPGGVGERLDDLQLLDDRAGPAVRDDERQRVLVARPDVEEVDVEAVDLGGEVRQCPRLGARGDSGRDIKGISGTGRYRQTRRVS
jgi:hypothetical protein